jgi:hypothetical protein
MVGLIQHIILDQNKKKTMAELKLQSLKQQK